MPFLASIQRPARRLCLVGGSVAVLALAWPPAAQAHGDVESSVPSSGSRLRRLPDSVSVRLAEPPAPGSDLVVVDGCGQTVSDRAAVVATSNLVVPVSGGEPGRWNVKVRSLSSVDGHVVREAFTFTVGGTKDCPAGGSTKGNGSNSDDQVQLGDPRPPIENEDASFPLVPVAVGIVVLIGLAVALRRSRS